MWSSLRNVWSKCEILEITEGAKRVLNLSNGMEEIVNPANVWNGTPRLGESPFEILFQIGGKIFASCHRMTLQLNKRGLSGGDTEDVARQSVTSCSSTSGVSARPTKHLSKSRGCNHKKLSFLKTLICIENKIDLRATLQRPVVSIWLWGLSSSSKCVMVLISLEDLFC